jgi:hypothetical protein
MSPNKSLLRAGTRNVLSRGRAITSLASAAHPRAPKGSACRR